MSSRVFAVVPAAGRSRRMGRPKLLLPYRETTVIGQLLTALSHPNIAVACVVVRPDDAALRAEAEAHGAWVVQPAADPPDMRASVEFALAQIADRFHPAEDDAWLLIPADHPLLSPELLATLLAAWQQHRPLILAPTYEGRRGHPALFRWSTVAAIPDIPPDRGLNWLAERFADQVHDLPCRHPEIAFDLDTPQDYDRLLGSSG